MYYTRDTSDDCIVITTSTTGQTSDVFALVSVGISESFTSITHTISGDGVCYSDSDTTGTAYAVNSSEYTTSTLLANVAASLPAFSGAYHTYNPASDYAYYDLSTDEITATETKMQYRFALPNLTGYTCYRISWSEKFVPESGSTVYTSLSYTWDGSATYAGPYTINVPTTQGTTTVVSVAVSCTGC